MNRCNTLVLSALLSAALVGGALSTSAADSPGLDLARQLNDAFVSVADKVAPAVVVINVTEKARPRRRGGAPRIERGEGSGIIVSADGYILTNNHVVENADTIEVELRDGHKFEAEVKGTDPDSDIAVVKIKPGKVKLTVARLGNSDKLRVGEFVVAIGHPYQLNYSVTVGHVSAIARTLPQDDYDTSPADDAPEYIQTDAVINPGNSGGPLVNLDGEVIGVNAMIEADTVPYTHDIVNHGIGLAIPINQARIIQDRLISDGKFTRSRIGVKYLRDANSPEARAFFNLDTTASEPATGVKVSEILPNSAAEKAGMKVGDIIVAVDGAPVKTGRDLRKEVAFKRPGQSITVSVLRDSKPRAIKVITEEAKPLIADAEPTSPAEENPESDYGFAIGTLTKELAEKIGMNVTNGVVVTSVQPDSLASSQGIYVDFNRGDVIIKLNGKPVTSEQDFTTRLKAVPPGKQWTVEVIQKSDPQPHFKVYHVPMPQ